MTKKQLLFALSLGFMVVAFSVTISPVHAQTTVGLDVRPALVEGTVDPGKSFGSVLRFTNMGSDTQDYTVVLRNITSIDSKGYPVISQDQEKSPYDIASWIQIPQNKVTIKSGETVEIPFVVNAPNNAPPGGHFGGIFLAMQPTDSPNDITTGASIGYQVGSLINLTVSGDVTESIVINNFNTTKSSSGLITFSTQVQNLGNVLLRPHGPIEITNVFGSKVGIIEMNDSSAAVFPNSTRTFTQTWQAGSTSAGPYRAIMALSYGSKNQKIVSATTKFWMLSNTVILIVLVLIAVLCFSFYLKGYLKRYFAQYQQQALSQQPGQVSIVYPNIALISLVVGVVIFMFLIILFFVFS